MPIKVGVCGAGSFAQCFIPLFKAHPLVSEVVLSDLNPEKLQTTADNFGITRAVPSLDELCESDVDAIAIITQHWMHAPQAVQALQSGKHVYSAVPTAHSLAELTELVQTVEATGLIYMVGETSYYYPCTIFCREQFQKGAFGKVVYSEAEYYHDWDHGLYDVAKWRGGDRWREIAGDPPMYYPTHSTSMVISVTGAYMTQVSCMGWVDEHEDGLYGPDANIWGNPFSNQTALFRMSDGSTARINEFRRIGHPGTVGMSMYGTAGSYEEQTGNKVWVTKDGRETRDLNDLLACTGIPASEVKGQMGAITSADGTHCEASKIHPLERLPKEFIGLPNSHNGSHQFLVDDFVLACENNVHPPNNIWQAARYFAPGLAAHESAMQGGKLIDVPDFGATQSPS